MNDMISLEVAVEVIQKKIDSLPADDNLVPGLFAAIQCLFEANKTKEKQES